MNTLRTVVFDLDGTLLDSSGDLAVAANQVRRHFDLSPLTVAEVEGGIGWGLGHLLGHVLPEPLHPRLPEARAVFIDTYSNALLVHSEAYPGAAALLRQLPRPVGLVTNKPMGFTTPILEGLGWSFDVVLGGDSLPQRKPDPAPLLAALEQLGCAPEHALFVGDSEVDQATAAAAGVRFAAVPWGRVAPQATFVLPSLLGLLEMPWARR